MKKILAMLLAGMVTVTAFAGCGGQDNQQQKGNEGGNNADAVYSDASWADAAFGDEKDVTLKVWAPDAAVDLTKKQVEAFKEHYADSGVKFNIEVKPMEESEAATNIVTDKSIAADVFGFPSDQFNRLMSAKVLQKLGTKFANSVKAYNDENPVKAATFTVDDKEGLYAFPETADNGYYLVYDNSVVTHPETLEGILADCKAAGRTFIMDGGNGFYGCVYAFTGGAKIDGFESDGTTQKFTEYDETEVVNTLMAFAKLMKDYKGTYVHDAVAAISTGFTNKKVGAGIDGSWDTAANKKALGNKLGAAKLPTINVNGTDKQLVGLFGYKYIGVNVASKYPRSAMTLAYYLAGQECQEQRAKSNGWGPSNKEAAKAVADDPILVALFEQGAVSVPQVNIADTLWTPMGNLGAEMYKDSWDPANKDKTLELFNKVKANIRDEG